MKLSCIQYLLVGLFSLFILIGMSPSANAQANLEGKFGLGVILGEPTGISVKVWTNQRNAFAGGAAWSLSGSDNATFHIHADYVIHNFNLATIDEGALGFYYGVGARVLLKGDDSKLGVRVPLGINYIFERNPIELFVEIVPIFDLIPDTGFNGNGGIGIRYYF